MKLKARIAADGVDVECEDKVATRIIGIINEFAQEYKPAVLPDDIERFEPGKCFDSCALVAARSNGKYTYVEGMALDPETRKHFILHAWVTDGIHAFDPTWRAVRDADGKEMPMPSVYAGIPMEIHAVANFMRVTTYRGVLGNRWRNPFLADQVIRSLQ